MKTTLITDENLDYFKSLAPDEYFSRAEVMVGAYLDDKACGILIISKIEDEMELSYIYVDSDFRKKGVGKEMLSTAHFILARLGYDYLRCSVIDNNRDLWDFFVACDFEEAYSDKKLAVKLSDLSILKTKSRSLAEGHVLIPLGQLPNHQWISFCESCEKSESIPLVRAMDYYSPTLSFILSANKTVKGAILVKEEDGIFNIDFLAVFEDGLSPIVINLISAAANEGFKICPDDATVTFTCINDSVEKLVNKLSGGKAITCGQTKELFFTY